MDTQITGEALNHILTLVFAFWMFFCTHQGYSATKTLTGAFEGALAGAFVSLIFYLMW